MFKSAMNAMASIQNSFAMIKKIVPALMIAIPFIITSCKTSNIAEDTHEQCMYIIACNTTDVVSRITNECRRLNVSAMEIFNRMNNEEQKIINIKIENNIIVMKLLFTASDEDIVVKTKTALSNIKEVISVNVL